MRSYVIVVMLTIVIGGMLYLFSGVVGSPPEIYIRLDSDTVGSKPFDIEIASEGQGLKAVSIVLARDNRESTLVNKSYPKGIKGDIITVSLDPSELSVKVGIGELIVTAESRSYLGVSSMNIAIVSKKINLDFIPPKISIISTEHYVNHGGSGLVIYKASPDAVKTGVSVGHYFFPGYEGHLQSDGVYLAFFAYPYDLKPNENIVVTAQDKAGNQRKVALFFRLKNVSYRKSKIKLSNRFIENVGNLLSGNHETDTDYKEIFLRVNNELRKRNDETIRETGSNSKPGIMWKGAFHQLSNSKVEANFADERTYFFNDELIDRQYHLGYDLAVTKRYPIEVANNGVVVYADELGIYGNTVIIDHGMGLSTLYGHMSSIEVRVGDEVKKEGVIGRTGQTGLAAGDHLHYGVYINGVAVRPIEWWDAKWIRDNITLKIDKAKSEIGSYATGNGESLSIDYLRQESR